MCWNPRAAHHGPVPPKELQEACCGSAAAVCRSSATGIMVTSLKSARRITYLGPKPTTRRRGGSRPPPPPEPGRTTAWSGGRSHRVEWRKVRRKGKRWEDPPRNLPSGQPKRGGHLVSRKLGGLNQEPHKISPVWMTWRCREVRKQSHGARLVHIVCSRYPRSPCRQGTRGRGYSQRHRPKYSNRARSGWWQPGDRRRT